MAKGPKSTEENVLKGIEQLVDEAIEAMPEGQEDLEVDLEDYKAFNTESLQNKLRVLYNQAGWTMVNFKEWEGNYENAKRVFKIVLEV